MDAVASSERLSFVVLGEVSAAGKPPWSLTWTVARASKLVSCFCTYSHSLYMQPERSSSFPAQLRHPSARHSPWSLRSLPSYGPHLPPHRLFLSPPLLLPALLGGPQMLQASSYPGLLHVLSPLPTKPCVFYFASSRMLLKSRLLREASQGHGV